MKISFSPWLRFFRLPNLPTVPGDALAGAVLGGVVFWWDLNPSFYGAAIVVLFAYMFGLADNDIAGAKADRTDAPERPIPAGEITLTQARIARAVCLLALVFSAYAFKLLFIYPALVILLASIFLYNRLKNKWRIFGFFLMGLCRGMSFFCGVLAIAGNVGSTLSVFFYHPSVVIAFLAWTLHTAAITWLASDEHKADKGMDGFRFIPGMAALFLIFSAMTIKISPAGAAAVPIVCGTLAYAAWCHAVLPLGKPHTPGIRRRAVGRTIGSLMFMQAGFILLSYWGFIVMPLLFIVRAAIRHYQPKITGS